MYEGTAERPCPHCSTLGRSCRRPGSCSPRGFANLVPPMAWRRHQDAARSVDGTATCLSIAAQAAADCRKLAAAVGRRRLEDVPLPTVMLMRRPAAAPVFLLQATASRASNLETTRTILSRPHSESSWLRAWAASARGGAAPVRHRRLALLLAPHDVVAPAASLADLRSDRPLRSQVGGARVECRSPGGSTATGLTRVCLEASHIPRRCP